MTYVRTMTGDKILCCWDDCQKPGQLEIQVRQLHKDGEWWNYLFCTERHKEMFINGHVEYGYLPVGSKGSLI